MRNVLSAIVAIGISLFAIAPAASAETASFPTFGIAFTPPAHATFGLTESGDGIALYTFDKQSDCPGAAICVQWIADYGSDINAIAKNQVQTQGATIDPGVYTIGKEKAIKVTADYKVESFVKRQTYLVAHGNWAYAISAYATDKTDASKEIEQFLPTVVFSAPESPIKHFNDPADLSMTIFDSFSVDLPRFFRKLDWEDNRVRIGFQDFSALMELRLHTSYSLDIKPLKVAKPVSFAAVQGIYNAAMQKGMSINQQFVWHDENTLAAMHYTDAVQAALKGPDGKAMPQTLQFGMLELGPGNFVQFVASINVENPDEMKACIALSTRVLTSVKLTAKHP